MKKKNAFSDIQYTNNQKLKIMILTDEFNIKSKEDLNNFKSIIEFNYYDNIEIVFLKSDLPEINTYIANELKTDIVRLSNKENYDYFVSKDKDFLNNKFSISEIENISNLYLINVKMFRLSYNSIIDECGYYMYRIGDIFPYHLPLRKSIYKEKGELAEYDDSLGRRLDIYCITIDNLYISLLNRKLNISVDQTSYHFTYYILQMKSIMDNLAEMIRVKYDLKFDRPSKIDLFNNEFKIKLLEKDKNIYKFLEDNRNINEIVRYYRNDFSHGKLAEIMRSGKLGSDEEEIIIKINENINYSLYDLDKQVSKLGKDKYLNVFYVVEILNEEFAQFINALLVLLNKEWYNTTILSSDKGVTTSI